MHGIFQYFSTFSIGKNVTLFPTLFLYNVEIYNQPLLKKLFSIIKAIFYLFLVHCKSKPPLQSFLSFRNFVTMMVGMVSFHLNKVITEM